MIKKEDIIKERVSIESILNHYNIQVNRSNFCVCMFHKDTRPSMKVNKKYVHCFSCHKSSDVIGIVMEMEKCNFEDAVKYIDNIYKLGICSELTKEEKKKLKEQEKQRKEKELKNKRKKEIEDKILNNIITKIREINNYICYLKSFKEINFSKICKLEQECDRLEYLYEIIAELPINQKSRWFWLYGISKKEIGNAIYTKQIKI